jgi:hypothetical protein
MLSGNSSRIRNSPRLVTIDSLVLADASSLAARYRSENGRGLNGLFYGIRPAWLAPSVPNYPSQLNTSQDVIQKDRRIRQAAKQVQPDVSSGAGKIGANPHDARSVEPGREKAASTN